MRDAMRRLPPLPPTPAACVLFLLGVLSLLVSLWAQAQMWLVELGWSAVAPGGGEYMVALFLGLPLLLLALVLLGLSASRRTGASLAARVALLVALVPALGWLVLLVRDVF